jgi:type IV pilus assembly protein PilC
MRRGLSLSLFRLRKRRVDPSLLLVFAQELAALLKAGLPLFQSLDVMLERQRDPLLRQSLAEVREKVKSGTALSDAFRQEGDLYPPIFAASLVAGERSGNLDQVLRRFAGHLRLNVTLKKKAVSASVYPLVLLTMMVALVSILVVWVIPQFKSFYEGLGAELPLATRMLLALATTVRANLLWIVLGAGLLVLLGVSWLRREGSGVALDRALLRLPYFGGLMRMYATSQLTRTLSTLLAGGLPLLNALEVAAASIGNRAMARAVATATGRIREGASLTTALESTGMLEALPLEMVKVGEHTGALGDMLNAVADFYDEDLDTRMATVLSLVEPVLLVLMAFVVAAMLLAFYLPMFQAISAVQGGVR